MNTSQARMPNIKQLEVQSIYIIREVAIAVATHSLQPTARIYTEAEIALKKYLRDHYPEWCVRQYK